MSRSYRMVVLVLAILLVTAWGLPAADPPAGKKIEDDPFVADSPSVKNPTAPPASQPPSKKVSSLTVPKQPLRSGEAAINEACAKPVQLQFVETPLNEVIVVLRNRCGIEIQLDTRALNDDGIGLDTPVTASLHGVPLRSALNHVLRQLGLTWTIRNDVLLITTPPEGENLLHTKIYDVADLVVCRDEHGVLWDDYDTLIDVISRTIKPTSWDFVGGPGSIAGASLGKAKVLVVAQTREVQEEVVALLADIREVAKNNPDATTPTHHKEPPKTLSVGRGGSSGAHGEMPKSPQDSPPAPSKEKH